MKLIIIRLSLSAVQSPLHPLAVSNCRFISWIAIYFLYLSHLEYLQPADSEDGKVEKMEKYKDEPLMNQKCNLERWKRRYVANYSKLCRLGKQLQTIKDIIVRDLRDHSFSCAFTFIKLQNLRDSETNILIKRWSKEGQFKTQKKITFGRQVFVSWRHIIRVTEDPALPALLSFSLNEFMLTEN